MSFSKKQKTNEFGWNKTGWRRWRITKQSSKSTVSPPKSVTSVKFVQRVHHFPVLVKGLQGTNGGIYPARNMHMAAHHRPQSEERMGCMTAFYPPPPFFNSLIKEHWHVSAGNGAITVFGRRFLTNEHTSVNTPVNTIKSIVEGNLSKGDSDSALNSVHETWD